MAAETGEFQPAIVWSQTPPSVKLIPMELHLPDLQGWQHDVRYKLPFSGETSKKWNKVYFPSQNYEKKMKDSDKDESSGFRTGAVTITIAIRTSELCGLLLAPINLNQGKTYTQKSRSTYIKWVRLQQAIEFGVLKLELQ